MQFRVVVMKFVGLQSCRRGGVEVERKLGRT